MAKHKCSKCGRTFKMPAHLARHMSAGHGVSAQRSVAKKATNVKIQVRKKAKKKASSPGGAPRKTASQISLGGMSVEELTQLIVKARVEVRRKISEVERAIK